MRYGSVGIIALLLFSGAADAEKLVSLGGELQVNSYTTGKQEYPRVSATDKNSTFVVVWDADFGFGDDTSDSVQARRLSFRGVFGDDFETADWSNWSRVEPWAAEILPAPGFVSMGCRVQCVESVLDFPGRGPYTCHRENKAAPR